MKEVKIIYNPYKVETKILINGEPVKPNSKLNVGEKRLQEWIEELPEILDEEYNSDNYKIIFHGTSLDFDDIKDVVENAKDMKITCEHIQAKEVKDKERLLSEVFEEIKKGPIEDLKTEDLKNAFEEAMKSEFRVSVVATMSAGKSTMINALLHQKIMPAKNEACTAIVTEIRDNDSVSGFKGKAYDRGGRLLGEYPELSLNMMDKLNSDKNVSVIKAEGDIPFVPADKEALVLVDTPGPNNSRDESHKEATYKMLGKSSKTLILYIMNATQLGVNDDSSLLDYVAESIKISGRQSNDRFLFVVNKLDDFKKGEDSVEAAIEKVRKYLGDKGIDNPNIFPASALTALDIRTTLKDIDSNIKLDDIDDDDILGNITKIRRIKKNEDLHLEKYSTLPRRVKEEIAKKLFEAQEKKDIKGEVLIHTGIVSVEEAISMYLSKYSKTAKIKTAVNTFWKKLESAKSEEILKKEIATNKEKQEKILRNIELVKNKINDGKNAKQFKEKIKVLDFKEGVEFFTDKLIGKFQETIRTYADSYRYVELSTYEVDRICNKLKVYSEDIQTQYKVELEEVINEYVIKKSNILLNEYKDNLKSLSGEVENNEINLDVFELLEGEIDVIDMEEIVERASKSRWKENEDKAWYKPWTWLSEKEHYENYIDAGQLALDFLSPLENQMYTNNSNGIEHLENKSQEIKEIFYGKFDELDDILNNKLKELEKFANDSKEIDKKLEENAQKLIWLEKIQGDVQKILEI